MQTSAQSAAKVATEINLRDALRNVPPSEIPAILAKAVLAAHSPEISVAIFDRASGLAWEAARR